MKRGQPTAILVGDEHLREDIPICRTDDFLSEQERKVLWLRGLQAKYGCPVLSSGDMFDRWKPPLSLVAMALRCMADEYITVPGNHDLPGHNINMLEKSGLAVLSAAKRVRVALEPIHTDQFELYPFPWGSALKPHSEPAKSLPCVAVAHVMTWVGDMPWPGCEDLEASKLLDHMKGYDLVLTGHNHKTFVVEKNGRLLVNPGSLMRTTAIQTDHKPCVFLWYARTNEVVPVYVPINKGVISRRHINSKEEKDERMQAYVSSFNEKYKTTISFDDNLEAFYRKNHVRQSVKDLIGESKGG